MMGSESLSAPERCCEYCGATPRKRHAEACPNSSASRRKVREAYARSGVEGVRCMNTILAEYPHDPHGGAAE